MYFLQAHGFPFLGCAPDTGLYHASRYNLYGYGRRVFW